MTLEEAKAHLGKWAWSKMFIDYITHSNTLRIPRGTQFVLAKIISENPPIGLFTTIYRGEAVRCEFPLADFMTEQQWREMGRFL